MPGQLGSVGGVETDGATVGETLAADARTEEEYPNDEVPSLLVALAFALKYV